MLAATALTGGALLAAATAANAADNPLPWQATETSENEQAGTLVLYDRSGAVVTTGSLSAPLAAYAVASGGTITSDDTSSGANAYVSTPAPGEPAFWGSWSLSLTAPVANDSSVNQSYSSLPASVRSSNHMVVPLLESSSGDDESIGHDITNYPSTYPAPNNNVYEIRILGASTNKWYVADIEVNPTDSTWTQIFPAPVSAAKPDAPTAGTPTATTNSVTAKWTAPSDNGSAITGYTVEYKANSAATWNTASSSVAPSATSYVVRSLLPGTKYDIRIAATNAQGPSDWSSVKTVSTLADTTALTISRAVKIAYGKTVTVTGAIKDSTTGKAMAATTASLFAKPTGASAFTKLKDVKSSSTGALTAVGVKPAKTTTYQWRYAGTAAHRAATSANDVVTVTRTATIKASPATIRKGKLSKIYGVVAPVAGGTATVQKKSGTRWIAVGHPAIKRQKLPNGLTRIGYVFAYRGAAKGRYTFRVWVPAVTGYAAVISPMTTVTVS